MGFLAAAERSPGCAHFESIHLRRCWLPEFVVDDDDDDDDDDAHICKYKYKYKNEYKSTRIRRPASVSEWKVLCLFCPWL